MTYLPSSLTGLERVQAALELARLRGDVVSPGQPMPTVPLAAAAVGCRVDQIIKTVVFVDASDKLIVAIANGTNRIDKAALAKAAGVERVKLASADLVFERTGYPAGGVSPIGMRDADSRFVMDRRVLEQDTIYGGAGTEDDLLHVRVDELQAVIRATIGHHNRTELAIAGVLD